MLCRVLFLFLFFAPARVFLTTQAKLNAPARHILSHTPNPPRYTLSHTLLCSTLNHQAKCASYAFFCSHTHAPSHLNATRQICHINTPTLNPPRLQNKPPKHNTRFFVAPIRVPVLRPPAITPRATHFFVSFAFFCSLILRGF